MNVLSGDIGTSIVALNCGHIIFGANTTFSTLVPKWFHGTLVAPSLTPRLLTPAFVACSTVSNKCWDEKAWVQGYM